MEGIIIFLPNSTNLKTKHGTKHVLYCMLCFRFNEAQLVVICTKSITNMSKAFDYKYTKIKSFRTNKVQCDTLKKLKTVYNIDVSQFIRLAIKEKIEREYLELKEKLDNCPF